jgi:DNA-binding CsgD family transcriptional regulator
MSIDLYGNRTLTVKENTIAALVTEGMKNSDIGARLQHSEGTIRNKLRVIFDKSGTWSRLELALWWLRQTEPLSEPFAFPNVWAVRCEDDQATRTSPGKMIQ